MRTYLIAGLLLLSVFAADAWLDKKDRKPPGRNEPKPPVERRKVKAVPKSDRDRANLKQNKGKEEKYSSEECLSLLAKIRNKNYLRFDEINECFKDAHLFEGDLKLTKKQRELIDSFLEKDGKKKQEDKISKRAANTFLLRWEDKDEDENIILPYQLDSSLAPNVRNTIVQAAENFERFTCIRLQPRTNQKVYLNFVSKGGCWSYVGRVFLKGGQDISLADGCESISTVKHESLHALGFWHEQSRPDRDEHVIVNYTNIEPDAMGNFFKYYHWMVDSMDSPYDIKSILHYNAYAFTKNGKPTILDRSTNKPISTSRELTVHDIEQLNKMYGCKKALNGCSKTGLPKTTGDGYFIEDNEMFKMGEMVNLKCRQGYEYSGPRTATCQVGGFTPSTLTCKKVESCNDKYSSCKRWSEYGYCDRFKSFMESNCKKSCKICIGGCGPFSDLNGNCPTWRDRGFCTGYYELYMTRYCQKSCNTCDNGCSDTSKSCSVYQNRRYCENSRYNKSMKQLCPKTCNLCS